MLKYGAAAARCLKACRRLFQLFVEVLRGKLLGSEYRATRKLVDKTYYERQARDLWLTGFDAALHYNLLGWRRGLDPNPLFNTDWYLGRYDDIARGGQNPFGHYLRQGWYERRDPGPDFSTTWYLERYADIGRAGTSPLLHYLLHGMREGRRPKPSPFMQTIADRAAVIIAGGQSSFVSPQYAIDLTDFAAKGMIPPSSNRVWSAIANDAQFLSLRSLPASFMRVRVEGRYMNLRKAAAREAMVELYFDHGLGFDAREAFVYPIKADSVSIDDLILIENDDTFCRFDPTNSQCDFEFTAFSLTAVSLEDGLRTLFERSCGTISEGRQTEANFLEHLNWAKITEFVRSQGQAIPTDPERAYERWMSCRHIDRTRRQALSRHLTTFSAKPLFSVLMPTYKAELSYLKKAIDSVRSQIYPHWELCIVDDGSHQEIIADFLSEQAALDKRILIEALPTNQGIAAATNRALTLAKGDFIALLDHDDELAPQALFMMAQAINRNASADMLYSDEDKIDVDGVRTRPMFKPDWCPEFLLGCMYTCHLGVYRRSLAIAIGGFRSEFDFAQDYDLALRISVKARAIVHVPDVLYHWRMHPESTASGADAKPMAELAARRAVQAHVDALGLDGKVLPGPFAGSHRVRLELLGQPLVSIIIPTAARRISSDEPRWFILDLLRSIRSITNYKHYEIVLIDNGDVEPLLEAGLQAHSLVRRTYLEAVFNISEKLNIGVEAARGEFVILLNDDMMIITPAWIEELVSWIQRPGIVAAGAKLLFPDKTVQHAGILLLAQGPSHVYYGLTENDPGLVGSAVLVRNYTAVTGACLALRKQDYHAVDGFDPKFRINYNDVDFCLRLSRLGRIVYTPYAKLFHYESVSRDEAPTSELSMMHERWESIMGADPNYNVHLSQTHPNAITPFPQDPFSQDPFSQGLV